MTFLLWAIVFGILISIYAYYIELKAKKSKSYKAFCDIGDRASCTKAFASKYGKTFGISNSLGGILFYVFLLVLFFYMSEIIIYFAIFAFFGSIYLAYISYFRLKNLCIICSLIYLINILLVIFSYLKI